MKPASYPFIIFIICFLCLNTSKSQNQFNIIPIPQTFRTAPGQINISEIKQIIVPKNDPELIEIANIYKTSLGLSNVKIVLAKHPSIEKKKSIVIAKSQEEKRTDFYALSIAKSGILINVQDARAAFYALQTIQQLLESGNKNTLPFYVIEDYSNFTYRGMHLDVSRHFFPISFIKLYIDLLARYKFNYFHWHLTDDQGWRIEIKKFPDLTEIGSKRSETLIGAYGSSPIQYDGKEYSGYYTQDDIREVVQYAKQKFVEIIPEIEMPGHSAALLASYPQFGCHEGPYQVATTWGVSNNVLCPTDTTIWFMKEILNEVCDLFPGKYVHIGGDEVSKADWMKSAECAKIMRRQGLKNYEELQSYFIKQIDAYLTRKGKTLIGWDEILEGGLSQNAVVMSWRGMEGGIAAAKQKHPVIFTPGSHCYFDHYQSLSMQEPLAIGGYTSLEKVYSFQIIPKEIADADKKYILGAQGNVWTEYIPTEEQALYMAFPRAIALAEVLWSGKENRDYSNFLKRLTQHIQWFKENDIKLSNAYLDIGYKTTTDNNGVNVIFNTPPLEGRILFESNSTDEGLIQEYLKSDTILLKDNIEFKTWYQLSNNTLGRSLSLEFKNHKLAGKSIQLTRDPASKYNSGGKNCILNGIDAPGNKWSGQEWLGFEGGNDFEGIIQLNQKDTINELSIQLFQEESSWIYLPKSIEVFSSNDTINFEKIYTHSIGLKPGRSIVEKIVLSKPVVSKYLKILVKNYGTIEEGRPGAGKGAWIFIGEIRAK